MLLKICEEVSHLILGIRLETMPGYAMNIVGKVFLTGSECGIALRRWIVIGDE